jgi:hypothetical protein
MLPIKGITDGEHVFFVKLNGDAVSSANAYRGFKKVYPRCGIAYQGEHSGPRVHDLSYPNKNKIQTFILIY